MWHYTFAIPSPPIHSLQWFAPDPQVASVEDQHNSGAPREQHHALGFPVLRLDQFTARLIHQCEAAPLPADLAQLAKDAIHFYALMMSSSSLDYPPPTRPTKAQIAEAVANYTETRPSIEPFPYDDEPDPSSAGSSRLTLQEPRP